MAVQTKNPTQTTFPALEISEDALKAVADLMEKQQVEAGTALRVYVAGMGCSGPQIGMGFDPNAGDADAHKVYEFEGGSLEIVVDPASADYLDEVSIAFEEGPKGGIFRIDLPAHMQSGGCASCSSKGHC